MGNCFSKLDISNEDELQSVIFYRHKMYNKEIIMWDIKRAISYMANRGLMWIKPPDENKNNEIRLHVEKEDKYESLNYMDVGDGIVLVFGQLIPPEPRRKFIKLNQKSYKFKKNKIHTLSSITER